MRGGVFESRPKISRDYSIDMVRGIAVLAMVVAHAIDFYHDGSSLFLKFLVIAVNTVAFTIFLFLSGAVSYIVYLKNHHNSKTLYNHIGKRLVLFLCAYYLLAFFSVFDKIASTSLINKLEIIGNILIFKLVLSYTEFLIPFLIFSALLIPCRKLLTRAAENWRIVAALAIIFYLAGAFLYSINVPEFLIPYKAILVGHNSMYRFPVFQYFPVYLIGLYFGKLTSDAFNIKEKKITIQLASLGLFAGLIISVIYSVLQSQSMQEIFNRWPPSVPFLALGLLVVFIIYQNILNSKELKHHPFIRDSLLLLGQNAFALYWTHIVLLKIYRMSGGMVVSSAIVVLGLAVILIVTSMALATFIPFNFGFHLTFIRDSTGKPFRSYQHQYLPAIYQVADDVSHKPRLRHRLAYFVVGISLFLVMISFFTYTQEKIFAEPKRNQTWWSLDYSYNRPINLVNIQPLTIIQDNTAVNFSFNHKELVEAKKSLANGDDVRLVFFDGHHLVDIPRSSNNWGSDSTVITFKLQKQLGANRNSNRYFIYYGNPSASSPPTTEFVKSTANLTIELLAEARYEYFARSDRIWYIKSDAITKGDPLIFTLSPKKTLDNDSLVRYIVKGTSLNGYMLPSTHEANVWESTIDLSSLPAGKYTIQAVIESSTGNHFSQNITVKLSEPLYVVWSWDWEGYDVSDSYLRAIESLSAKHNIKLSHFFSPRIYTAPTISPKRSEFITNWIKNRRDQLGEEINLHLHMFPDYVVESGVTPKDSPRWDFYQDGYDILTTAYGHDDMSKMLTRAKQYFMEHGLGTPLSYRAGGWYANLETLRALQDAGLKADSSARTSYKFGSRKEPGFWDVSPTLRPYYPSTTNQNSSLPNPNFSILEIPNNGADSYSFSANDMIDRFKQNFDGSPLVEKQQITYLSHPHWFKPSEQNNVDTVFNYVDNYLYNKDSGPVVYTTTNQVYEAFRSR